MGKGKVVGLFGKTMIVGYCQIEILILSKLGFMEVIEKIMPVKIVLQDYAERISVNGITLTRKREIPIEGKPRNYLKARKLLADIKSSISDDFVNNKNESLV